MQYYEIFLKSPLLTKLDEITEFIVSLIIFSLSLMKVASSLLCHTFAIDYNDLAVTVLLYWISFSIH